MSNLRSAAAIAMLLWAGMANAALYQFSVTGDYTASWQLNSTVTPDASAAGTAFRLYDVGGNFPGSLSGIVDLTFYNGAFDGSMEIYDFYARLSLLLTDGPQLYTGAESAPTFKLGTFGLTEYQGPGNYLLTVTDLTAPALSVPEPASAALLIGGLGLMFARRKREAPKQA
jgi:hypothetical protein